jgi:hypothetical protein
MQADPPEREISGQPKIFLCPNQAAICNEFEYTWYYEKKWGVTSIRVVFIFLLCYLGIFIGKAQTLRLIPVIYEYVGIV